MKIFLPADTLDKAYTSRCLLACSLLLLLQPVSQAMQPPDLTEQPIVVPDHIAGVQTLSAEEVIDLAIKNNKLVIIDARVKADRKYGYIENSISLPDIDTRCEQLETIIPASSTPTVFYCNGIRCGRSVVSIKIAKSCGYTHLYWFKGGFEEWKNKSFQYPRVR